MARNEVLLTSDSFRHIARRTQSIDLTYYQYIVRACPLYPGLGQLIPSSSSRRARVTSIYCPGHGSLPRATSQNVFVERHSIEALWSCGVDSLIDENLLRSMILISPSSSSSSASSTWFHRSREAPSGSFARSTARSFISRSIESSLMSWRLFSRRARARSNSGTYSLTALRSDGHD